MDAIHSRDIEIAQYLFSVHYLWNLFWIRFMLYTVYLLLIIKCRSILLVSCQVQYNGWFQRRYCSYTTVLTMITFVMLTVNTIVRVWDKFCRHFIRPCSLSTVNSADTSVIKRHVAQCFCISHNASVYWPPNQMHCGICADGLLCNKCSEQA